MAKKTDYIVAVVSLTKSGWEFVNYSIHLKWINPEKKQGYNS